MTTTDTTVNDVDVHAVSLATTTTSTMSNFSKTATGLSETFLYDLNAREARKLIIPIVYTAVMMAIGILGNSLVIYIYNFRWSRTPTRFFVSTLAVFDLVNCVITMPTELAVMYNFYYFDHPIFCKLSRCSTFWMNNNSAMVLLIIAVDRYIKICLPTRRSFSYRGAKIACCVAIVIGIAVSWPSLILYGNYVRAIKTRLGEIELVMCNIENKMDDTWYLLAYYTYLWVGFLSVVAALVVLYVIIGAKIWMRKVRRDRECSFTKKNTLRPEVAENPSETTESESTSPSSPVGTNSSSDEVFEKTETAESAKSPEKRSRRCWGTLMTLNISKSGMQAGKATLTLFFITLVFIVSFVPYLVLSIIRVHYGLAWFAKLSETESVAVNLFVRSYLISNTVNPLIYGFCNTRFRRECSRLFKRLTCR